MNRSWYDLTKGQKKYLINEFKRKSKRKKFSDNACFFITLCASIYGFMARFAFNDGFVNWFGFDRVEMGDAIRFGIIFGAIALTIMLSINSKFDKDFKSWLYISRGIVK